MRAVRVFTCTSQLDAIDHERAMACVMAASASSATRALNDELLVFSGDKQTKKSARARLC